MNLPFYIARRYVLSKKTHNVINIISGISVFGIAVSTMAMVIVLSGFNGIEHVIKEMYSGFDSDIRITKAQGKTLHITDLDKADLLSIDGVTNASYIVEETVILRTAEQNWVLGKMKGVEDDFLVMNDMDRFINAGENTLYYNTRPLAIMGAGLLRQLDASVRPNNFQGIKVLALTGDERLIKAQEEALNEKLIAIGAQFSANPKYDDAYMIVPINFAMEVLKYDSLQLITGIELSIDEKKDPKLIKSAIEHKLGSVFKVEDKYDQNRLLFSTHESEKWMTFLILCFIFVLATFNMIASLTMLVLDKRKDMHTLHALGMTYKSLRRIFINEGLLINFLGAFIGLVLGLGIALGQQYFGWIDMGDKAVVTAFPIRIIWLDLLWIFGTVLLVGVFTTYIPVRYLLRQNKR